MTSARTLVRRPLRSVDDALWRLRDSMSPGQRWTGGLAVTLALAVLLFGQPTVRVAPPTSQLAAPAADPPVTVEQPTTDLPPPARVEQPRAVPPPGPPEPATPAQPAVPPAPTQTPDGQAETPPVVPRFTALVPVAAPTTPPGRDEGAIAASFLDRATVNAATVAYDPGAEDLSPVCDAASERAAVMTATPLPRALRTCLEAAGLLVLTHDEATGADGSATITTRPAIGDALRVAATWTTTTDAPLMNGAVGLAVDPRLEPDVEPVLAELSALGVDLVIVEYVTDVRDSVRAFADAGVDVTAFALPTELQREWVALSQFLLPAQRYVVVDAADAVTSEAGYSPGFDGARYVGTALPTTEPSSAQQGCLDRYGSQPLTDDERTAVLRWCQLADLADAAAARTRGEAIGFAEALTTLTFESPVTTPLGPTTAGSWGPARTHELVWRAACSCWDRPDDGPTAATVQRWERRLGR